MFEDVTRRLGGLETGASISIEFELDDAGFFDRQCPDGTCQAHFKVFFDDWRDKVQDEHVFCPICRKQAPASEWDTQAQEEQIKAAAMRYMQGQLNQMLSSAAKSFNRGQPRNSMIRMSMSYRAGSLPVVVPATASELLQQTFECEECHCRYSSLGAAFFCPACGHNSAISSFQQSVDTVRKTLQSLPDIRQAICDAADADVAENTLRHLCENSLVKLVSSFQRLAEALFDKVPNRSQFAPRRNLFQNLGESNDLWRQAIGVGYTDMLPPDEYRQLQVHFQQRHLLAHKDGLVDQDYLDRSGDTYYALGQRLVVRPESVDDLANLVDRLGKELRSRT